MDTDWWWYMDTDSKRWRISNGGRIWQWWWYMAAVVVYGYGSVVVYGYGLVVVYGYGFGAVVVGDRGDDDGAVAA